MKKFLVLFIFLSLLLRSYAQDLIITTGGDTIECSIQLVKPDFIYYSIKVNDEFRTVSLPAGNVLSYRYETSEPIVPVPKVRATSYRDFGRLRLSFNTGYGYQLGKIKKDITPDLTEYQEKLKSGYQFGGSFSYFLSKYFGLGVEYRSFRTSNSKDKVRLVDEWGFTEYGTIADNINISLYNFIFTVRASRFPGRDSFYATYGLGYIEFRDKAIVLDDFLMKGGTLGMSTEIGYDIGLSESCKLGFQLTYITGMLTEYQIDDGKRIKIVEIEKKEDFGSLYRLDFSAGIRFNF